MRQKPESRAVRYKARGSKNEAQGIETKAQDLNSSAERWEIRLEASVIRRV